MDRTEYISKIDEILFRSGPKCALKVCEEGLECFRDDPDLLRRKAQIYELVGDFPAAVSTHRALGAIVPDDRWSLERLICCLIQQGNFAEARLHFDRLDALSGRSGEYDFLRAEMILEEGNIEEAQRIIQVAKSRKLTSEQRCDYQWVQVMISRRRGDKEAELRDAIELSRLDPADLEALKLIRNCHAPCTRHTRGYWLQVEGEAPLMALVPGRKVYYMASFEVLADSKSEALRFVREIEFVAVPESLKIMTSSKLKRRIPSGMRKGVVFRYPSFSAEAASSPADLFEPAIH